MKKMERVVTQSTSGRWILTVLAGWAFFAFCMVFGYVMVKQRMEFKPETLVAMFSALLLVIQGVYKDYFNKNGDGNGPVDEKDSNTNEPDKTNISDSKSST
jgi:hypothetical protein